MKPNQSKAEAFIRDLCKGKSEEEIREANETFRRYIALVKRICERLEREELERENLDSSI
jgi:signal transduction histidine kinase